MSPPFTVTSEEFLLRYYQAVTRFSLDGVEPPILGAHGGTTVAINAVNYWSPWIDEKIVNVKYDGVCRYTGTPGNRPTFIKDYHTISLMRAVDYLLAPQYLGMIIGMADTVIPAPPGLA